MRLYASNYPEDVAALVLIDAFNTDVFPDEAPLGKTRPLYRLVNSFDWLGAGRLLVPLSINKTNDTELDLIRRRMISRSKTTRAIYAELAGQSNWHTVRDSMSHLGDLPVLIISRGNYPAEMNTYLENWKRGQKELEAISHTTRRVVAEGSGHDVQFDAPELIVRELRQTLEEIGRPAITDSAMEHRLLE